MALVRSRIFFVAGIHGVGKSHFTNQLAEAVKIPHLSAGQLIAEHRRSAISADKRVVDVAQNQDALIAAIDASPLASGPFLLDGHFCVLNAKGTIENIPTDVFAKLSLVAALVLHDLPATIQERLRTRDGKQYPIDALKQLQDSELNHAQNVCTHLGVPLLTVLPTEHQSAIEFVTDGLQRANIA